MCLTPRIYDGLAFSQGQTMNVRVPVVGHPVPAVTWFKDGEELLTEAGRREVWLEDGCALLNVSECRRVSDRAVYGVRVRNDLGVDEATFTVEITGDKYYYFRRRQKTSLLLIIDLLLVYTSLKQKWRRFALLRLRTALFMSGLVNTGSHLTMHRIIGLTD